MNPKILIVDDEPDILKTLDAILSSEKYQVRCASGGEAAIHLFKSESFDLVITDIRMPGMDGMEVLKQVKQLDEDMEVIILTGFATVENAVQTLSAGQAFSYLTKPLENIDELIAVVNHALEKRRLRLENRALIEELEQKIKEEKQAVEYIRKAKKEWERTFDAIEDIITIQDTHKRIIRMNKAAAKALNADFKELIGKHCYEIFRGGAEPCDGCPQLATIQNHRTHSKRIELELLGRTFEVSASPIFDDSKKFISLVHVAKDITGQKKLETQLRQSQKMEAIGTLAGGIAHDFNNILMAITGNAEIALNHELVKESPARHSLEQILKAGRRATDLVRQILTFSRQKEQEVQTVWVAPIVKEAVKLLRSSLPATIEIRRELSAEADTILGDPSQILQVLMNLCTNAAHAMRERGGLLAVSLSNVEFGLRRDPGPEPFGSEPRAELLASKAQAGRRRQAEHTPAGRNAKLREYPRQAETANLDLPPGPYLRLTVSDTGHGMEPAVMERIFEPYFTTKPVEVGTGLGMAVVHGIVKSIGGAIAVESQPGKGSTFDVFLPRIEGKAAPEIETREPVPGGSEHILVVDDEAPLVDMAARMLGRLGYEVSTRTSSRDALEAFRLQPQKFDLVITDMTMPHLTGDKLAEELLRIRPDIPIILCTGHSDLIDAKKARRMGIREFFMKPLITREIALSIRRVLDQ